MVPNEKRDKLDAKCTKCLFLDYCKETKAYRLMRLQTKKITKVRYVIFMEDGIRVEDTLEMCPSGRNEGPIAVDVDKSSKSPSCDDSEEREQQLGDHFIAKE